MGLSMVLTPRRGGGTAMLGVHGRQADR